MRLVSLAIFAFMALVSIPATSFATTTETIELEEPKTLPLTDAVKSDVVKQDVSEFWQEDFDEVVIRKQRGAKDNGGSTTTGKKKDRTHGSIKTTKIPKTDKPTDSNLETNQNTTFESIGKKHQQYHSKHEKTNSKKHTSTIKPKPKGESNYYTQFFLKNFKKSL